MTLPAGARLGPYVILSPLGAGGMGEVYRARDTRLTRDVAVKILPEHLSNPNLRERFDQEAKVVAQLAHPHICALHDVGREGDLDYLVMDYLEGESLLSRIARGPLPIREALIFGIQISEALDHAHHAGVVHRDLKPGNIFLTKAGVKVLDFGLARRVAPPHSAPAGPDDPTATATGPQTTPGTIVGTLSYMSPEQLQGKEADARSDIFAFGLILYEMVAGRPAFTGASRVELTSAIMRDDPTPLTQMVPLTPPGLERLVRQCLAKAADQRWEAAHDLTNALRWIRDEMTTPPVAAPAQPAASKNARRYLAFIGAIVAALAAAFGAVQLFKHRAPIAPPRIAVLPFDNQGDPSQEYFADGVTDEVRNKLFMVPGIEVIARGSSAGYKKASKSLDVVAKELSVGYVLTGTVRWENSGLPSSRVHISPELVEIRADSAPIMRWQQNFDAGLTDVFEVQSGIASQVAEAMNVVLSPPQLAALAEKPTKSLEGWEAYVRGRQLYPPWGDTGAVRKAIAYYEHAVDLDPRFAQAWAILSRAHSAIYENAVPSPAEAAESKRAAEKALALAPNRAETLLAGGYHQRYVKKDDAQARMLFERALRLFPLDADVLVALADLNVSDGRWGEAAARLTQARRIDPRNARVAQRMAKCFLYLRRFPESLHEYDQGLALSPKNFNLIEEKAMVFLARGDLPAARSFFERAAKTVDRTDLAVAFTTVSDLYWALSPPDQDRILNTTAEAFDGDLSTWALAQAEISWIRGERDKAADFGKRAADAAESQLKDSPANSPRKALLGLAYAYAGRPEKAIAAAQEAVKLLPIGKDADRGPYIQLQLVRVYLLLGEQEKALNSLEPLLKIPFYVTPSWLAIDPTFDPLRNNPRFQRLLGEETAKTSPGTAAYQTWLDVGTSPLRVHG